MNPSLASVGALARILVSRPATTAAVVHEVSPSNTLSRDTCEQCINTPNGSPQLTTSRRPLFRLRKNKNRDHSSGRTSPKIPAPAKVESS